MKHYLFLPRLLTSGSIHRKQSRGRVSDVIPCCGKADAVVAAASGNVAVIAEIVDFHTTAILRFRSVPEIGDRLTIGKIPGQRPVGPGRRAGVIERNGGLEATGPLIHDGIRDVAA